jgi:SAM-dependent methyltransferase
MVDRLFSDADLAALYDGWWPQDQRKDFDFYLPLVMSAEAVLDAGCGTGALLHAARESGHKGRLCGLDPAAGMLAQARKRRDIEWVLGDLSSIAWAHEFDLVVMTGHAFQALIEDDELRRSLAAIRLALTNNGRFAFETRNPLARAWEDWTPENAVEVTGAGSAKVRITTQVETLFDGRTVSFTHTFTSPTWAEPRISRSTLRFLDADLLSSFLDDAGLVIEEQFGDWDRQPLKNTSPEIINIARPR